MGKLNWKLTPIGPQGPQWASEGRKMQIVQDLSKEAQISWERTLDVLAKWIQWFFSENDEILNFWRII